MTLAPQTWQTAPFGDLSIRHVWRPSEANEEMVICVECGRTVARSDSRYVVNDCPPHLPLSKPAWRAVIGRLQDKRAKRWVG